MAPHSSRSSIQSAFGSSVAESENSSGGKICSQGRPGSSIEVHCRTTDSWVPGQIVEPEHDGKVTVKFQVGQSVMRKSIKVDSEEIRVLHDPCGEPQEKSTGRLRHPFSESEAIQQLEDLKAKEHRVTSVPKLPARSTAAMKWTQARRIAQESQAVELWCSGVDHLNGVYMFIPTEGTENGPPVYQKQSNPQKWLFVAKNGSWWIGDTENKDGRQQMGWMRSEALEPGTLPHMVDKWEAPKNGEWEVRHSAHFWLLQTSQVAWQQLRVSALKAPVIEVRGVIDAFVDGFYDFIPGDGGAGEPPAFQHQQRPNLWLFLAQDQRWWIGNSAAKEARDDRGILHSAQEHPDRHPAEATGWHVRNSKVWEECKALKIQTMLHELPASEKWNRAWKRVQAVEIWGKERLNGEYTQKDSVDGVPTYQSKAHPDVWLYLGTDGAWWLSDSGKDLRKARGAMCSDVVKPGTLPQDVDCWKELKGGSWEINPGICVLLPQAAADAWEKSWTLAEEDGGVIEMQGVKGPLFNGMYDMLEPEGSKREPPVFQHQINQELFLYVAADGRWWVSKEKEKNERAATGRMHSELIRPGMLPFHRDIAWHVFNRTSKEWERQDDVVIR